MKPTLSALVLAAFVAVCSCSDKADGGGNDGDSRCTPGASVECACIDGSRGAQICAEDGTLEACQCAGQGGTGSGGTAPNGGTSASGASGTAPFGGTTNGGTAGLGGSGVTGGTSAVGGNAGTAALGGSTGLGGTSATGGSASGSGGSGPADSEHIYFDGTVTYEMAGQPSLVRHLTVCARCEAAYTSASRGTITFWVGEDTPQWNNWADMSMQFLASAVYFRPAEYLEPYYGAYAQDPFGTTSDIPNADSCVHADDRVLAEGGHVTGTLDCTLSRRNTDRPAATAHIVGSFHAEFPSQNP